MPVARQINMAATHTPYTNNRQVCTDFCRHFQPLDQGQRVSQVHTCHMGLAINVKRSAKPKDPNLLWKASSSARRRLQLFQRDVHQPTQLTTAPEEMRQAN